MSNKNKSNENDEVKKLRIWLNAYKRLKKEVQYYEREIAEKIDTVERKDKKYYELFSETEDTLQSVKIKCQHTKEKLEDFYVEAAHKQILETIESEIYKEIENLMNTPEFCI